MTVPTERGYGIGPLAVDVTGPADLDLALVDATLGLYDVRWPPSTVDRAVRIEVAPVAREPESARGDYLVSANMAVDRTPGGLRATTLHGAAGSAELGSTGETWSLAIPVGMSDGPRSYEVEDLLSLVLTTGWRRAGWVPLHAAGLVRGGRGLICCATSGGGKTTFTVAMVRRGWQALGDDKLLLEAGSTRGAAGMAGAGPTAGAGPMAGAAQPRVRSLLQVLNLDPAAAAWFPEVADLGSAPAYSFGNAKRRQPLSHWPGAGALEMVPTDLLVLERTTACPGIVVSPLGAHEVLEALLRQTVFPTDRPAASVILGALGRLSSGLRGWRVQLGPEAYEEAGHLDRLESALL